VKLARGIVTAVALGGFAIVFVGLTVGSFWQKSATVDEPMNLTGGYVAWRHGNHCITPQNEMLARLWCALPLLARNDVRLDGEDRIQESDRSWRFAHRFLHLQNDADRLLRPARCMTILLGLALGAVLFAWAREMFGCWPAVAVLALYATEPNLLAHSGVVTSDMAFTLFFTVTLYFAWRTTRVCDWLNALGLMAAFSLALLSKHSGVVLWVVVLALLATRAYRADAWPSALGPLRCVRARMLVVAGICIGLIVISYLGIWALYGFRHAPIASGDVRLEFTQAGFVAERAPLVSQFMSWMDGHRLLPNAYAQGFALKFAEMSGQPAFLAGRHSETGWWHYFPFALLIKTPLPLLLLAGAGAVLTLARRDDRMRNGLFVMLPLAVYLGVAMTAKTDVGVRYVLPVIPLALLLAGRAVADSMRMARKWVVVVAWAFVAFQALESVRAFPDYLAYFNQLVGGSSQGHRYLVDSNLDWGQDLKGLKRWMDENRVEHINLSYFGSADPAYYGIDCTYLAGSPVFKQHLQTQPRLPGYVAVSATNLQGVYLGRAGRDYFKSLRARKPVAVIGHSIHVYWVEGRW